MLIGFFVVGLLIALIVLATPLFLSDINKVYAADSYTVTFQDDDGTILKESTVLHGQVAVPPENPSKVGHYFKGWNPSNFSNITEDKIFKATYGKTVYKLIFNECYAPRDLYYQDEVIEPEPPTNEAYIFIGWFLDYETFNIPYEFTTMPAEDVTIYAKWTPKQYKVTYNLNGGIVDGVNPDTYDIEDLYTPLINPTRKGYIFIGWSGTYLEGNTNKVVDVRHISEPAPMIEKTYTAHWEATKNKVLFKDYQGIIGEDSVDYDTKINKPIIPIRANLTFAGWYTSLSFNEAFDFNKIHNEAKDIYAKWTSNINIKLFIKGKSEVMKQEFVVGKEKEALDSLLKLYSDGKTGYTLKNFRYKNLDDHSEYIIEHVDFNYNFKFEIIGDYEANKYKISFHLGYDAGGTSIDSMIVSYDDSLYGLPEVTRKGFNFDGWWYCSEGHVDRKLQNEDIFNIPHDVALSAKWGIQDASAAGGTTGNTPIEPDNPGEIANLPKPTLENLTWLNGFGIGLSLLLLIIMLIMIYNSKKPKRKRAKVAF